MKGLPGGMASLMKQANQMQMKMKKAQEDLAKAEYDASVGGGAVTVKVNGDHMITALTISADLEMLMLIPQVSIPFLPLQCC